MVGRPPEPVIDRLMDNLEEDPSTGCFEWQGYLTPDGYGKMSVDSKTQAVHRVAYELFVGPIPKWAEIDHLCFNKRCANPEHLEAVPHTVNVNRYVEAAGLNETCKRGHPRTPENVYNTATGYRQCRPCVRISKKIRLERAGAYA